LSEKVKEVLRKSGTAPSQVQRVEGDDNMTVRI